MDTIELQNIYQAAWCMHVGLKLVGKKNDGHKVTLIFQGEDAEKKAFEYFNGGKAPARELFENYRSIKDSIFER